MASSFSFVLALGFFIQSQAALSIPDRIACGECRILISQSARLGGFGTLQSPQLLADAVRNSRGEYYVGPVDVPGAVAVFDAAGKYLRSFSRRGSGPGEHGNAFRLFLGPGDTLAVYDFDHGRVNIFSPDDKFLWQVSVGSLYDLALVPGGRLLINATRDLTNQVLHVVGKDGVVESSFGESGAGSTAAITRRAISQARGASVWIAHPNKYVLEQRAYDGKLLRTVQREQDWFEPWLEPNRGQPFSARPRPTVKAVAEDKDGLLWVLLSVPDANWKPTPRPQGISRLAAADADRWTDTVIEVLDLRTGRVLARQRLDRALTLLGPGIAGARSEDAVGARQIEVFELRVDGLIVRR